MGHKETAIVSTSVIESTDAQVAAKTPKNSWKGWLWDSADVSKEERRFLLKVCFLTPHYRRRVLIIFAVGLHIVDIWDAWNVDQMGEFLR